MISRADIDAAAARIDGHIRKTPVLKLEPGALGHAVTLKLEHLQVTGSFKVRGAFNNLLSADLTPAGVVATSGGNHGAAVAYAATKLGVKSTVFVPASLANPIKIARMEGFGAEVIVAEGTPGQVFADYHRFADDTGALAIHPYDAPLTLAGQGTVAREMTDQIAGLDTVFISVGGGGLIGGAATWFGDDVKVVAVESEGTATLDKSLKTGDITDLPATGVAASSLGAPNIGTLPFEVAKSFVDENIVVTEDDIYAAQRALWEAARIASEPGAAVALAPLISGAYVPSEGETVGVLVCGGNAEPDWFLGDGAA